MAVDDFAINLRKKAAALRSTAKLLRQSASEIEREIKRNFDKGQNAGIYRISDAGVNPGQVFQPLAKYTIAKRKAKGVHHEQPLKETGRLYRDISISKVTPTRAVVGPRSARSRKIMRRQLGGHPSTDLQQPIPPRNPIGYRKETYNKIREIWLRAFGVRDYSYAKIDIDTRL